MALLTGLYAHSTGAITNKDQLDWGYINKKGKLVIKPKFSDAKKFSNGLAAVKIKNRWGYINKKGKWIIRTKKTIIHR